MKPQPPPSAAIDRPVPFFTGTLPLADGRRLAWAEFGVPQGVPVLYCHGTPGSRLEAALAAGAATRLGLRLIAADRPGYGTSTAAPGRGLFSVAEDLRQLCDHLGLGRLLLLGVSGGGPFACATACALGPRVAALGLVGPVGPIAPARSGVPLPLSWRLLRWWGRHPWLPAGPLLALARWLQRLAPDAFLTLMAWHLAGSDRRTLARRSVNEALLASLKAALAPGYQGVADDLACFSRAWGLSLPSLGGPTLLWHGRRDRVVPPRLGIGLARDLPHCRARFPAAAGHFSLPIELSESILAELLTAAGPPGPWYTDTAVSHPEPSQEPVMEQRIETFLAAAAYGVVGASSNRDKYGNKVLRCYQQHGRRVIPVNPREAIIEGIKCVPSVAALPPDVTSISVITPPPVTEQVVREAIAHGIRNIWMQPGAQSAAAVATCEAHGINVIADGSCILVVLGYQDH